MAVRGPRGSSALALFAQVSAEFLMHQCKMGCNEVQALLFLAPLVSFFFYFYFFLLILAAISTDGFWALWIGCNIQPLSEEIQDLVFPRTENLSLGDKSEGECFNS